MAQRVEWRGVTLDARSAAMMQEVAGLVRPYVQPTQGSWSTSVGASADTHSGPGAIDVAAADLTPAERAEVVAAMRKVGWAAWLRTPEQANWPFHIHGIAVGCDDLPPAAASQVRDYLEGRNGLAGRGSDDGPRDWVGVTWESYLARKVVAMAASVWFMSEAGSGEIWCVAEDCGWRFYLGSPKIATDIAYIVKSGGGKVLKPPDGVPVGDIGGNPVWEGVAPETFEAIPKR